MSTPDLQEKSSLEHVENVHTLNNSKDDHEYTSEEVPLTWRTCLVFFFTALSTFGGILSITGIAGVLSFIIQDVGTADGVLWLISGPTVVQATLCPWVARLSDLTGQRKWFIIGPSLFGVVGGIIGGTANTMPQLIAAQVVIGAGLTLVGVSSSIPSEILSHRRRSWAQGIGVMFPANAASVVGSVATGAMVRQAGGWRTVYWILTAVYATVCLGFFFFYKSATPPNHRKLTFAQLMHESDALGSFLFAAGVGTLLVGLTWGGSMYPWTSAGTLAPIIIGVTVLTAFGIYEWKGRDDGILAHSIFRLGRNFSLAALGLWVEGFIYFAGIAALLPRSIRAIGWSNDGLEIGGRMIIFTAAGFVTTFALSAYVTRTRDMKWPLVAGFSLFTVAIIMLSQAGPGPSGDNLVMGALAVAGVGFAAPLVLLNGVVQLSAPAEIMATVTAFVASMRALGGSVGSAVVGSILASKVAIRMPELVIPAALEAGLPEESIPSVMGALAVSPGLLATVDGMTPSIMGAIMNTYYAASAWSYAYVWYSIIPWCVVAVIAMLCLKSVAKQMTEKVDRPYELKDDKAPA